MRHVYSTAGTHVRHTSIYMLEHRSAEHGRSSCIYLHSAGMWRTPNIRLDLLAGSMTAYGSNNCYALVMLLARMPQLCVEYRHTLIRMQRSGSVVARDSRDSTIQCLHITVTRHL
jgi:hypothetical protein